MTLEISQTKALTFDLFGTVLDLGGSLTPFIADWLKDKKPDVSPDEFWKFWRYRQRIEQYQDNIVEMGHSGYRPVARRALVYVSQSYGIQASTQQIDKLMGGWQELKPFPEVLAAMKRLSSRFKLVALSNGEPGFLDHLVNNQIQWKFDAVISVQTVGKFKPNPGVYRKAASILGLEVGQCLMVSANSFDVMGARMCGLRGAFVNRYKLPYEDSPFEPDLTVADFTALANELVG